MESYIKISTLNDYIFCPKSIYFHELYGRYNAKIYHRKPQTVGKIKHEKIDSKQYSSEKKYLQSLAIFSEKYGLCGKIDLYNRETASLIERKTKIKVIYDGYRYQLYAQYFCMLEMGYPIKTLCFHSLVDNTKYPIALPDNTAIKEFETLLLAMRNFDIFQKTFTQNPAKCVKCIYRELCDV